MREGVNRDRGVVKRGFYLKKGGEIKFRWFFRVREGGKRRRKVELKKG